MIWPDLPLSLRAYLQVSRLIPIVARPVLRRRLSKGKELPDRWTEKLGLPGQARPDGQVIWLHGVGLGEVLALRGLIAALAEVNKSATFLVTSTTAKGASALAQSLPERTIHQFLPLDAPGFRRAFLDHWKPDLCVWSEQDLWPGLALDVAERSIPQAIVAGRMDAKSFAKRLRWRSAYAEIYRRMALIDVQDAKSKQYFTELGASDVKVRGTLKPAAPPLQCDAGTLRRLQIALGRRYVWITAPSHAADEALALAAHREVCERRPGALLIIAPRFPDREVSVPDGTPRWSQGQSPDDHQSIWLADTTGDLGLFYRLADSVLIGGTQDDTEGHNPWEAIALDTAVLHGPRIANFADDYARLSDHHAAVEITTAVSLAAYLCSDLSQRRINATALLGQYRESVDAIARDLLTLMDCADV